MSATYTPRAGSFAQKTVEYFNANPEAILNTNELAEKIGFDPKNMSALMERPVSAGLLTMKRDRGMCFFSRGVGVQLETTVPVKTAPAPQAADGDADLVIALYNDGELFLGGSQPVDGGVLLNAAKTAQLREYLLHTGSFIEHLQRGE